MIQMLGICLFFLSSCAGKEAQIIDDIIEGEAKTAEKVIDDTIGQPPSK